MTHDESDSLFGDPDDSRRSFLKKGALASGALVLGASGTATAQDGGILDEGWKALIHISNFHPNAQFTFVSGVVEWVPNYGDVNDSWFSDYNTYQIRWLNSGEVVPLFVAHDANIGEYDENLGFIPDADDDQNQPQVFEMNREWTPFSDNQEFITVNASPVGEDEEDNILENDDWWQ
ncbi:twin-arginine translocation signal domain-containing protein [Natrinema sp. 1APR25-10V2]|uniref:twin-arginine translocation signal domain-containing protein n=1 Tax=Natrinema sp. 1APR25-10V2 TaxID=2951081 RepID=UPI0028747AB4|nr:twin-arginine translocation signal domain-containing protein [Natrinema sp. 1APR25-10V2]MDS0474052.1 twin-arginine translocation signal domain-containing protein [Natrinema sp. 1APR25-10V2]